MRRAVAGVCIIAGSLICGPPSLTAQSATSGGFAGEARRLVAERSLRPHALDSEKARAALARLYGSDTLLPFWSTAGRPNDRAMDVVDILMRAEAKGLRPEDYDVDALRQVSAALTTDSATTLDVARFDVSVTTALLRFVSHLHMGRADPRALRFNLPDAHRSLDLAALIVDVAASPDAATAIGAAEPPYAGYRALLDALARYRALAADSTLRPPELPTTTLRPGDALADAASLRRLLVAMGDLDAPDSLAVRDSGGRQLHAGALVPAIASFQRRHGLDEDGVIGPATRAQLQVPLAARVRQIELTLERWRWLPDRPPDRYAVVNVPAFRVSLFENDERASRAVLGMAVIVGLADGRHHTPVFSGTMREVVFRPYWDVPPSIARGELLPIIRRRPDYLDRTSMEIVRGGDDDATVFPATADNLARVADGTLRLRQRPGPGNALGLVKFVFPNRYNVFMHGTPDIDLFLRSRRDFSHGCIRVERPTELAERVLHGTPGWDRLAIERAMFGDRMVRVPLARPVEVFVLYGTAVAREDGTLYFHDDLYGHDARLTRVLDLMWKRRP